MVVPECLDLFGAKLGIVFGIEKQNDRPLFQCVIEMYGATGMIVKCKVRGQFAGLKLISRPQGFEPAERYEQAVDYRSQKGIKRAIGFLSWLSGKAYLIIPLLKWRRILNGQSLVCTMRSAGLGKRCGNNHCLSLNLHE